jgi:hypothetical protein
MVTCGTGTGEAAALAAGDAPGLLRAAEPARAGEVAGVLAALPPAALPAAGVTFDGELHAAIMQIPASTPAARNQRIMRSFRRG